MLTSKSHKIRQLPTPLAGLALGIASLGLCLENALPLQGGGQLAGAVIAVGLLITLATKFILHPDSLIQDLKHPVIGSVVPTFAMTMMLLISKTVGNFYPLAAQILWLTAITLHISALINFWLLYHPLLHPLAGQPLLNAPVV